ncbi:MAG: hypothetical protein ACLUSM_01665 [Enterococcus avium]
MERTLNENEQVLVVTDSGKKFIGLIQGLNPNDNTYFVLSENSKDQDCYLRKNIYDSDSTEMIRFLVGS